MADPYRWGEVPPRGVLRLRAVRENNGLKSQVPPAWKATAAPGPARSSEPPPEQPRSPEQGPEQS